MTFSILLDGTSLPVWISLTKALHCLAKGVKCLNVKPNNLLWIRLIAGLYVCLLPHYQCLLKCVFFLCNVILSITGLSNCGQKWTFQIQVLYAIESAASVYSRLIHNIITVYYQLIYCYIIKTDWNRLT